MRTLSTAQTDALSALDRTTFVRVKVEDPDGTMVDVTDHYDQDFLEQVVIEADVDNPISAVTITLRRKSGGYNLAVLDEDSHINRDSSFAYAPFLNPNRDVTIEVATLGSNTTPASGDWVLIWEGIVDEVNWGGDSHVTLRARDPMARLNDTFIETTGDYGDDAGTEDVEDVMQEILDAFISSPSMTLTYTATSFAVREYELGNVTVLEALKALADLIGWNLSWRWDGSASDFRLTLWEPDRTNTTAAYTFGQDDYYVIPRVSLDLEGIRNKGEVVYITSSGTVGTATETRTTSQTLYSTRFIRIDARGTSVVTATQAATMLDAILDDLEEPSVQQEIEAAFFWPVELGDLYAFSANDHYSTEQKWAVFGYRHVLSGRQKRTTLRVGGKPSGGYARWHAIEQVAQVRKEKPTVAMTVAQSGTTGSLDLTIHDPDFAVTNVQFAEKTDAGAYGSLATTWDRSTGTIGLDVSLTRGEDITLAAKHTASIRYVVTYNDGRTSGLTIEGAHAFDTDFVAEVTHIEVTFDADGEVVVSATGDEDTANMYVTVGDGSAPSDPTSGANDGTISGRNGTVSTGVKVTTGNDAYVKVIGYNSTPTAGPVRSTRQARRIGQYQKDTSARSHSGSGTETTLETITVSANTLGTDGGVRLTGFVQASSLTGILVVRIKFGGSTVSTFAFNGTTGGASFVTTLFNDGATNAQDSLTNWLVVGDSSKEVEIDRGTSAIDTTSSADLTITGQLGFGGGGTGGSVTLQLTHAELLGTD